GSPSVCAMRSAAALAASRRGSSTRILRPLTQAASSSASGTLVVLPAPGGATSTAAVPASSAAASSPSTESIGSGVSNCMVPASAGKGGVRQPPRLGQPAAADKLVAVCYLESFESIAAATLRRSGENVRGAFAEGNPGARHLPGRGAWANL